MTLLSFVVAVLSLSLVYSRPAIRKGNEAIAQEYVTKYGYLVAKDPKTGALRTEKELVDAIKLFQRYAGLQESGVVDDDTMKLMGTDRCGMADFSKTDNARRKRRYTLMGAWETKNLTYKIHSYTRKLPRSDQRATFAKAFKKWEAVSQLNIRETNDDNADIHLYFKRGFHGDGRPFFYNSRKFAHAFYPRNPKSISGDVHFNDYIDWTLKSRQGINLEWVAIHEFGHSLGLGHTRSKADIMYPHYQHYKENFVLSDDDVRGIQKLYGKPAHLTTEKPTTLPTSPNTKSTRKSHQRTTESPSTQAPVTTRPRPTTSFGTSVSPSPNTKPTRKSHQRTTEQPRTRAPVTTRPRPTTSFGTSVSPSPNSKPTRKSHQKTTKPPSTRAPVTTQPRPTRAPYVPDACTTSFDTFFMDAARRTYAFKGQYYWVIGVNAGLESGPHKTVSRWRELRLPVDAAFTRKDGRTVFFTGSQYYIYYYQRLESGPRHIRDYGLPDALSNMDAVFIWGGNGRTYFFKGDQYWRYDDRAKKIDIGYPRKINGPWKGVPANLDGAMKWRNGRSYFFKGNKFYRIADRSLTVERGYPKKIGLGWMKCLNTVSRQR